MAEPQDPGAMESYLREERRFPPPAHFSSQAHIDSMDAYERLYAESIRNPDKFWAEVASELHWFKKWKRVLEWNAPDARWFAGGKTNLCYNCVDRQVKEGYGQKTAIVWEGERRGAGGEPEIVRLTYADLQRETARFACVLKDLGVKKGDPVTLYMPVIPELAIAMLACARIGAPHAVIFAGETAPAIRERVEDARSRVLITADGGWRGGAFIPLKATVDAALAETGLVKDVVVVRRGGEPVPMQPGRDHDWAELAGGAGEACPCEPMDAEDLLFILYTSGTAGPPKGIMHTTGGYMVYAYLSAKMVFDLHEDAPDELFWCTADTGWITGHSYGLYGILPNRVPTLLVEGALDHPAEDRAWEIVERHRVSKLYTTTAAIRAFMAWGDAHPAKHELSSLKLLGLAGEPISPEAWMWFHEKIGGQRCPIVDTWWQTETGGHMLSPLPGATTTRPGAVTRPFFGVDAAVVDASGEEQPPDVGGHLVIRAPWPGMLRGIYGDRQRFIETYWSRFENLYCTGDAARKDANGDFWMMGRLDEVLEVAGHRLAATEVESLLASHPAVAEAVVVGVPAERQGRGLAAFLVLREGTDPTDALREALRDDLAGALGEFARPAEIRFAGALPRTRSGKLVRRLVQEVAEHGEVAGDTTSLEDPAVLDRLQEAAR